SVSSPYVCNCVCPVEAIPLTSAVLPLGYGPTSLMPKSEGGKETPGSQSSAMATLPYISPPILVLNASTSFVEWKGNAQGALMMAGCWSAMCGTDSDPARNERAYAWLLCCCKGHYLSMVQAAKTAPAAWKALLADQQRTGFSHCSELWHQINQLQLGSGESISQLCSRLSDLVLELAEADETVSEAVQVRALLQAVPSLPPYDMAREFITQGADASAPSLADVKRRLQNAEARVRNQQPAQLAAIHAPRRSSASPASSSSRHLAAKPGADPSSSSPSPTALSRVKCFKCGKRGHIARDCKEPGGSSSSGSSSGGGGGAAGGGAGGGSGVPSNRGADKGRAASSATAGLFHAKLMAMQAVPSSGASGSGGASGSSGSKGGAVHNGAAGGGAGGEVQCCWSHAAGLSSLYPCVSAKPTPSLAAAAQVAAMPRSSGLLSSERFWLADSGASHHITPDRSLLHDFQAVEQPVSLALGKNTARLVAHGVGNVRLVSESGQCFTLRGVLWAPDAAANYLSTVVADLAGWRVVQEGGGIRIEDRANPARFCVKGALVGRSYLIRCSAEPAVVACEPPATAHAVTAETPQLLHERLGHLSYGAMADLIGKGMVSGVSISAAQCKAAGSGVCPGCAAGKMHRRVADTLPSLAPPVKGVLDLVHTDVCGPFHVASVGGYSYVVTFLDEYSGLSLVECVKAKSDVPGVIISTVQWLETQSGRRLKALRSDNGTEYINQEVMAFLASKGIQHQRSAPYSPEQNGSAERLNRTMIEKVRCMLYTAGLPARLWTEAVRTANHLRNLSPMRGKGATPWELFFGVKPDISALRVFGATAYAQVPQHMRSKLEGKAVQGVLVGYEMGSKAYRVLVPGGRIIVTKDVVFDELARGEPLPVSEVAEVMATAEELSVHTPVAEPGPEPATGVAGGEAVGADSSGGDSGAGSAASAGGGGASASAAEPAACPVPLRQSLRLQGLPPAGSLAACVLELPAAAVPIPHTILEARASALAEQWAVATDAEMESLHGHCTWELVDPPQGCRPLDNRWVFSVKEDSQGHIARLKARLVVKGFMQREGVDFTELHAPVSKHATVRALLATAVAWDMDLGCHVLPGPKLLSMSFNTLMTSCSDGQAVTSLISSPGHMPAGPEPDAPEPEFSLASGSTELSTALAEYCKSLQLLPQDHPTSQRALQAFRTDRGTPRSIAPYPSGSRSADPKHNTLNTESCRLIIASLCDAFPEGYVLGPFSHLLDNLSTLTLKDMHHTEHNYTGFITTLTNLLRKDFGLKFCSIEPSEEPYRLPNCSFPAFEVTVTASSRDPNHKAAMLGLLGEIITAEGKLAAVPCVQQEGKGYTLVTRRPLLTCTPPTLPQVAISVQYDANFVAGSPTGQAVSKLGAKGQVATRFTGAVQYAVTKARTSPSRAHLTSKAFILCSAVATAQEEGNYLQVQFTSPYIASAVEQAGPITIQATDSVLMKWTPAASSQAQGLNTRTCLELGVSPASINSSSLDSQGGLAATVQRLGSAISSPFLLKRFSNQGTPQTIDAKKVTAEGDSGVAHFVGFYTRTGPVSLLSGATQLASFRRDSKRVPLCMIPANVGMSAALICTVAGMARSHRTILKDSTGRPITAAMHSSSFCGGGLVVGHPCTMGSLQATSQSLTAASTTLAAAHLLLGDSGKDFTITSIHSKLEGAFHQFRDAGKLAHNTLSEAQETSLAKIFEACQPLLTAIAAYTQAEDREDKATHRGSMRTTVDTIYAHMKEAPAALSGKQGHSAPANGSAERLNRTMIEKVRCMLYTAGLPARLWTEAVRTANHLRNLSPMRGKGATPWELFFGVKPDISALRVFGATAYAQVPQHMRSKLEGKAVQGVLVGYEMGSKAYRVLVPGGRIIVTKDVVFDELARGEPLPVSEVAEVMATAEELSVHTPVAEPGPEPATGVAGGEAVGADSSGGDSGAGSAASAGGGGASASAAEPAACPVPLRQSLRLQGLPPAGSLAACVLELPAAAVPIPHTILEARASALAEQWAVATDAEMESLHGHCTWELVDPPQGCRPLDNRWVFSVKEDSQGHIARLKARLVVKGFMQREGVDFTELHAPVSKHATVRALLATAVAWDMDLGCHVLPGPKLLSMSFNTLMTSCSDGQAVTSLISSPGHMPAGPEPDAPEPEFSLASGSTELSTALAEYCKSLQLLPQDHPTSQRALQAFRTDRGTPRSIAPYPSGSRSADPKHNTLNTESCRLIIASLCDAFPEGYVLGPFSHLLDNLSTLTLKDMHHTEHNYTGFITTLTNLLRKDFGLKFCSIEPSEEPYRLPNCSFPAFEVTVTASSRDPNHKAAMLGLLGEIITAEGKLAAVPCVQQEGKGYTLVTRRPLLTCTPPTLPQVAISVQYDANFVAGSPTGQAVSKLGAKGQVATRFTGAVQYAVTKARTSPSRAHLTSKAFILCSAVATAQEEGNYLQVQFTSPYIASAVEQAGPITIQATDSVLMKWTPAASSQAQGLNTRTCLELGVSPASINSSSLDSQGGLAATVQRLGSAISSPFLLKRFSNQGTPQTIDAKKVTAEGDSGVAHFVGFYTRTGPVSLLSGATQLASFRRDSKRVPLCMIPANVGMSAALICTVAGMARSHRTILKDSTGRPITAAMHSSSFCGGGLVVGHPCTMGSLQATSQSLTAASTTLAAAHLLLGDSGKDFTITSIHSKLEGAFHQFRDAGKLAHNTLSEAQETSLAKIFEACQPLLTAIAAYTQAEDREDKATHRGSMRTTVDTIYAHMKEAPAAPRRPFPAAHQQKGNKQRPQQPRPVDKAAAAAAIAPAESQGPSPSSKREPKRQASARSPTHGASTSRALAADMEAAASDAAKAMADALCKLANRFHLSIHGTKSGRPYTVYQFNSTLHVYCCYQTTSGEDNWPPSTFNPIAATRAVYVAWLLLAAGDVEANPGPTTRHFMQDKDSFACQIYSLNNAAGHEWVTTHDVDTFYENRLLQLTDHLERGAWLMARGVDGYSDEVIEMYLRIHYGLAVQSIAQLNQPSDWSADNLGNLAGQYGTHTFLCKKTGHSMAMKCIDGTWNLLDSMETTPTPLSHISAATMRSMHQLFVITPNTRSREQMRMCAEKDIHHIISHVELTGHGHNATTVDPAHSTVTARHLDPGYMERQHEECCLVHAFNMAMGRKCIDYHAVISHCKQLAEHLQHLAQVARAAGHTIQTLNTDHIYHARGKFSSDTLNHYLHRKHHEKHMYLHPASTYLPTQSITPETIINAIVSTGATHTEAVILLSHQHATAIKHTPHGWHQLDSFNRVPTPLSTPYDWSSLQGNILTICTGDVRHTRFIRREIWIADPLEATTPSALAAHFRDHLDPIDLTTDHTEARETPGPLHVTTTAETSCTTDSKRRATAEGTLPHDEPTRLRQRRDTPTVTLRPQATPRTHRPTTTPHDNVTGAATKRTRMTKRHGDDTHTQTLMFKYLCKPTAKAHNTEPAHTIDKTPKPTPDNDLGTNQHHSPPLPPTLNRQHITLTTFNVRGLHRSRNDVLNLVHNQSPDILILTETMTQPRSNNPSSGWLKRVMPNYTVHRHQGHSEVLIGIKHTLAIQMQATMLQPCTDADVNTRCVILSLRQRQSEELTLVATYWPSGNNDDALPLRKKMQEHIRTATGHLPGSLILAGDINATMTTEDRSEHTEYTQDIMMREFAT
ncbi:hypothetical protein QJQ45_023288, partial [Haematococcus lacustris]